MREALFGQRKSGERGKNMTISEGKREVKVGEKGDKG